jgi:hypothetical protein
LSRYGRGGFQNFGMPANFTSSRPNLSRRLQILRSELPTKMTAPVAVRL